MQTMSRPPVWNNLRSLRLFRSYKSQIIGQALPESNEPAVGDTLGLNDDNSKVVVAVSELQPPLFHRVTYTNLPVSALTQSLHPDCKLRNRL